MQYKTELCSLLPVLCYSGQWLLTLVGEILNLRESHTRLWSVRKSCPLLCARSSESHMHTLEGRPCCAWDHQHPGLLENSKSFSFSSAGITLFILHVDCTWQQIQQPLPRASQTTQPSGRFAALGGLAMGWTPFHLLRQSTGMHVTPWVQQAHSSN